MEKRKTTKGTKRTIFIYLLILAVFYAIIYVVPQVSDIFVETYSAEYGTLQIKDDVPCLFVRDEKVYRADGGGAVDRRVKAGRLMRTASHIVDVGQIAYYADKQGIVSYYCDGYEDAFTPENMETIAYSKAEELLKAEKNPVRKMADTVSAGDPIFKMIDNQQWYLVSWVEPDHGERYQNGEVVTVDFRDGKDGQGSTQLSMYVDQVQTRDEKIMVILRCDRYYEHFDRYRVKICSLITSNRSGILIKTDSLTEQDGKTGVYVVDKLGNYDFTPVQILDQDGETTVVEKNYFYDEEGISVETVKNYDKILRNPEETMQKE